MKKKKVNEKRKKHLKKFLIISLVFILLCGVFFGTVFAVNAYVMSVGEDAIVSSDEAKQLKNMDCILILGCGVMEDGTPSHMLRDRLDRGIELYFSGVAPKLIMSGDHGTTEYDEVNVMKQYAIDKGVPSEDVFMDHAGFSTYESIYRAKDIFGVKSMFIVTQEYHLYRALYLASCFDMEVYGVSSDYNEYFGQTYRDAREILARNKDFIKVVFKPEPTFLGEAIPVNGNGDVTND